MITEINGTLGCSAVCLQPQVNDMVLHTEQTDSQSRSPTESVNALGTISRSCKLYILQNGDSIRNENRPKHLARF